MRLTQVKRSNKNETGTAIFDNLNRKKLNQFFNWVYWSEKIFSSFSINFNVENMKNVHYLILSILLDKEYIIIIIKCI